MKIMCVLGWIGCIAMMMAYTSSSTSGKRQIAAEISANKTIVADKELSVKAKLDHIHSTIDSSSTDVTKGETTLKTMQKSIQTKSTNQRKFKKLATQYKDEIKKMKMEISEITQKSEQKETHEKNLAEQIPKIEKHIAMLKKRMPSVTLKRDE